METGTRVSTVISRRALVAAGTGWVLGAGGLVLPASIDEAEAREGALGGKMGGRHGKDHRGRNKDRGDENDNRDEARNQRIGIRDVTLGFENLSSFTLQVKVKYPNNNQIYQDYLAPGAIKLYQSGESIRAGFGRDLSSWVHFFEQMRYSGSHTWRLRTITGHFGIHICLKTRRSPLWKRPAVRCMK